MKQVILDTNVYGRITERKKAANAYKIVNNLRNYMVPEFISYEKFRRLFS